MFLGRPDNLADTLRAWADSLFNDHAVFRLFWTNEACVIPNRVYRGNHPTPRRCRRIRARGIKCVVNLRGRRDCGSDALGRKAFERVDIPYIDHPFESRNAPQRDRILRFYDFYVRNDRYPLYLHCKSGADRTGLVAGMVILFEGGAVEEAARQLHPRHLHFKFSRTGVLDEFFAAYARQSMNADGTRIPFIDWVRNHYDEGALRARSRSGAYLRKAAPQGAKNPFGRRTPDARDIPANARVRIAA